MKEFDILVHNISRKDITDEELVELLRLLKDSILLIGKEAEGLAGAILMIDWTTRHNDTVREYQSFMINLISSHPIYLKATTRMLVKKFVPRNSPKGDDVVSEDEQIRDETEFKHVQNLLSTIIRIAPLTPTVLLPQLVECFPYMTKHIYIQECFMKNLLSLSLFMTNQRCRILEIIVDKLTKLDVRSPRTEIVESESPPDEEEVLFELDEMDLSDTGKEEETDMKAMNHKEAGKLDVLMDLMFRYINTVCYNNGELDWEATKKLYRELLLVFEKIILPTHASCHIQFIMFFVCSFNENLSEGFIDYLWKKVQDPTTQPVYRQAAVAYMASLLARASFISASMIKTSLELMTAWAHHYIQHATYTTTKANISHHGPFYSVCQAIFYIFAFKHKFILETKKGHRFIESLNLQTLITSRLNPLKYCLPLVAKTFASITRQHQIAFCDTVMERNRRSMLPTAGSHQASGTPLTHLNPLDSFFPFDPYLLQRSIQYIQPLYKEYDGALLADAESSDEGEMEEEEFYEQQCHSPKGIYGTSPSSWMGSPKSDFLNYGKSPGFKNI